jgi:hypothetical protein
MKQRWGHKTQSDRPTVLRTLQHRHAAARLAVIFHGVTEWPSVAKWKLLVATNLAKRWPRRTSKILPPLAGKGLMYGVHHDLIVCGCPRADFLRPTLGWTRKPGILPGNPARLPVDHHREEISWLL